MRARGQRNPGSGGATVTPTRIWSRFDLEDFAAATLPDQQHAFDDWITTFNQVRPHEALGQRVPAEVYRVSARRLSRCSAFAGYPGDCREAKIDRQGWIRCEGLRVYISYALGGWTVGLQRVADGSTRVWFYRMLLGAFVPGRDTTIQPCAVDAASDEDVAMTNSAAGPATASAA